MENVSKFFINYILSIMGKREIKTFECPKGQIGCLNSQKEGHRHLINISKCGKMIQMPLKNLFS